MYPPYFSLIFLESPPPHDQLKFFVPPPPHTHTHSHPPHRNEKNVSVLVTDQHRKNRQLHLSTHEQSHLQSDVTHLQLERLVWYESYDTRFFKDCGVEVSDNNVLVITLLVFIVTRCLVLISITFVPVGDYLATLGSSISSEPLLSKIVTADGLHFIDRVSVLLY